MKLPKDAFEFIVALNQDSVRYLLVGAWAVAYYGYPRMTGDLDVWVEPAHENARALLQALSDFGFGGPGLKEADFSAADVIVQLGNPPNRIALLTSLSGLSFEAAWAQSVPDKLEHVPVRFLGRSDLIANKRASGRPKDLADVAELE